MSKVAVVYWSGTGNTETMANAVAEGAKGAGAEVDVLVANDFNSGKVAEYDGIAFGCPAMGAENLEESEFEPMFTEVEGSLSGKKIALFGSYATNSQNNSSDIDLLYEVDNSFLEKYKGFKSVSKVLQIQEELSSLFHTKVDLTSPSGLNQRIKEEIISKAIYV